MSAGSRLACRALQKRYGDRVVLDDLSLSLAGGACVALVGKNGAGKSTLLGALAGEIRPDGGEVRLDDRPVGDYPLVELARRRALLPQRSEVAFDFRVRDVVAFARAAAPLPRAEEEALVARALAEVGLSDVADAPLASLSGGARQRVHLARVWAQLATPEEAPRGGALLLDEPLAGQDPKWQLAIGARLAALAARGVLVVVVLHDLNLVARFCDRVVALEAGRVAADGPVAEVLTAETLARVFEVPFAVDRSLGVPRVTLA